MLNININTTNMFLQLPNEMIAEIGQNLTEPGDIYSLLLTSRHLAIMMQPFLDKASTRIQDAATRIGLPLIHHAANNNFSPGVKLALKLDPTCVNKYIPFERTPLHAAVCKGFESMVQFLLEKGADPNAPDPQVPGGITPDTPLNWALRGVALNRTFGIPSAESEGVVMLLLHHGADPNVLDRNNENAYLQASNIQLPKIIEAILDTGLVDLNSRNEFGDTALHIAASGNERRSHQIVKLLLDRGVEINALNNDGQTAIFDCWSHKSVCLLVKCGIDVGVVDYTNRTVLHYLADCVYVGRAAKLVAEVLSSDYPIDIGLEDDTKFTALQYATRRDNATLVKLLQDSHLV